MKQAKPTPHKLELPREKAISLGRALDLAIDDYSERWDAALQRQLAMKELSSISRISRKYKKLGFPSDVEQDLDFKIRELSEAFSNAASKYGVEYVWREPADFRIAGQRPQGISAIASFVSKCAIRCLMESDRPSPVKLSDYAKEVRNELRAGPSHSYFCSLIDIDDANLVGEWYYELTQPGKAAYAKRAVEMLSEKLQPGSPFTFFLCTRSHAEVLLGKALPITELSTWEESSRNGETLSSAQEQDIVDAEEDVWEEVRDDVEKPVTFKNVNVQQGSSSAVHGGDKDVDQTSLEDAKRKKDELIKEVADAIVSQAKKFFSSQKQ